LASVGERIRQRRKQLGWTQDELGRKAGISKGFLSNLENSMRSVGAEKLYDIARALGVSLDHLMTGSDVDTPAQDVQIPKSLADFAQREGVSFRHTLLLLDLQRRIIAARTPGKRTPKAALDAVDWRRFFEAVKPFL
jgi:transcriptional regulator with XRE-family HTH domain